MSDTLTLADTGVWGGESRPPLTSFTVLDKTVGGYEHSHHPPPHEPRPTQKRSSVMSRASILLAMAAFLPAGAYAQERTSPEEIIASAVTAGPA